MNNCTVLCVTGRGKRRLWKGGPSLSKGQGLGEAQIGLKCGSERRERFPLWSPAWLWVTLQARAGCQQLCTVTHLLWGHCTQRGLSAALNTTKNPSFVCSLHLGSVRRVGHSCWLFPGLSSCRHCYSGGAGAALSLAPGTALHLPLGGKAHARALSVCAQKVWLF